MTGAICGIAMEKVYSTEREEPRWCFGERKRVAGTWTLRGPTFEALKATEAWGWAEPVWSYECDGCHEDRRSGGWFYAGSGNGE